MNIEFSQHAKWDQDRLSVLCTATVDGKRVLCVVPQEYLTAPYAEFLDEAKAFQLFDSQRAAIQSKLRQLIKKGAVKDGEIILPC